MLMYECNAIHLETQTRPTRIYGATTQPRLQQNGLVLMGGFKTLIHFSLKCFLQRQVTKLT